MMILAGKSWRMRAAARSAFSAGQFKRAIELAAKAQEAQRTRAGEALQVLSELLVPGSHDAERPED